MKAFKILNETWQSESEKCFFLSIIIIILFYSFRWVHIFLMFHKRRDESWFRLSLDLKVREFYRHLLSQFYLLFRNERQRQFILLTHTRTDFSLIFNVFVFHENIFSSQSLIAYDSDMLFLNNLAVFFFWAKLVAIKRDFMSQTQLFPMAKKVHMVERNPRNLWDIQNVEIN